LILTDSLCLRDFTAASSFPPSGQMDSSRSLHHIGISGKIIAAGILNTAGNDACIDCAARNPDWASVDFGILICLQCSGRHRSFGCHITSVRSLKLDSWEGADAHVRRLQLGGNEALQKYITKIGWVFPPSSGSVKSGDVDKEKVQGANESEGPKLSMLEIYTSQELRYYKEVLSAQVEDRAALSMEEFRQRPSYTRHEEFYSKVKDKDKGKGKDTDADTRESSLSHPKVNTTNTTSSASGGASATAAQRFVANARAANGNTAAQSNERNGLSQAQSHWVPDRIINNCMLCNASFNIFFRKHHCRKCGKCVCATCAPADNTRPILELKISEAVRHCRDCYRSPLLKWDDDDVC
jgi:hypothetical protein